MLRNNNVESPTVPWPELFRRKTDPLPERAQRPWVLRTANLMLSPLGEGDVGALHLLWSNPEVRRYLWDGHELAFEQTRDLVARSQLLMIERGQGLWGAFLDDELVGFCGYWYFQDEQELELLFGVGEAHWLKGYAGEMLSSMIEYGFEHLKLEQIRASVDIDNTGSLHLLEGFGFLIEQSPSDGVSHKRFLQLPRERHVAGDCSWEAA